MMRKRRFAIKPPKTPEEKVSITLRWVAAGFTLAFIAVFFGEFAQLVRAFWELMLFLATGQQPAILFTPATMQAFLTLFENLIIFCAFLFIFVWLAAQFTLPVQGAQRHLVFRRLRLYMRGVHGPAVFIREGKQIGSEGELKRSGPGVAFVDHSSAVVLESTGNSQALHAASGGMVTRSSGPGIVFTANNEKIRGTVDLRKQARAVPDVHAFTRDGIDLTTSVIAIFTLGQDPDVLRVGYVGPRPEDLRVIEVDEKSFRGSNGALVHNRFIREVADDLDVDDRNEIFAYYQSVLQTGAYPAFDGTELHLKPKSPFTFDENRVKAAIYSEARNLQENKVSQWYDLPGQVAVQILRDMMMMRTYDDWFRVDGDKPAAIRGLKGTFSKVMRRQGVLAFQFVERLDGQFFAPGQPWDESELIVHPARMFRSRKVLRERGIKVIAGVFTDPKPKEQIRQQFFNKWQALQQEDLKSALSSYDQQVLQIINGSRIQVQKEMLLDLSRVLQSGQYSREALAMRMFQSLETIASDASTRKLIPDATLSLLRSLGTWLNLEPNPDSNGTTQPLPRVMEIFDDDNAVLPDGAGQDENHAGDISDEPLIRA
jgi:hypothetical protein